MKTFIGKTEEADHKWWVIDASGKSLGRLATQIATVLRGKDKPTFTPHADMGDFVIVVNADKITLSGTKWKDKKYYRHSRYFGSTKEFSAAEMLQRQPTFLVEDAVKGMLPKNILAKSLLTKLKTYAGPTHPHEAQKPQALAPKN